MICSICNKDEVALYNAISDNKIIKICETCSRIEGIPIVKKPTQDQLERANQRYTVHERMMKMSGLDKLNPVSHDHEIAQRHLAKIKIPEKKQFSDILVPNYDWNIMMARRRRKMTINQLAELTKIPVAEINSMEKGILPKNFEKIARAIESMLNISLLKETEENRKFFRPERRKSEEEILIETRERLFGKDLRLNEEQQIKKEQERIRGAELAAKANEQVEEELGREEKEEVKEEIKTGRFDFSSRNNKKNMQNVTLNDLVEMKKEREKAEKYNNSKEK